MLIYKRYEVEKKLGEGNFGITYLVRDNKLPGKPPRVLKQLKVPENQSLEVQEKIKAYFEQEAEKLGELGSYDSIPNLFDYFEENKQVYLVQEFIAGKSLADELDGKRLNESQVIQLLREILTALAIVHNHNVIHRDLKPDNIIRRSRDKKLVLIDFGAVKTLKNDPSLRTQSPQLTWTIGTNGYMPDEQRKGYPGFYSDVYAVGMIGIQALTGTLPHLLPYNPNTLELHWQERTQISSQLQQFLERMVRDDFRERYQNATAALQNLPSGTTQPSQPIPDIPTTVIPPRESSLKTRPQPSAKPVWSNGQSNLKPVGKSLQTFNFGTMTVNEQGEVIDYQQKQAEYFAEDLGNGVTLEMVAISGGTFMMGSPDNEEGHTENESPLHWVEIQPFYMGRYQVTQAQWQVIMGNNPSNFKGDNLPVETVSWNDANEFCQRLTQKTGFTYRLPSEAEWEYACRAGTTTPFHFGATITTDLANYYGNSTYASAPKGINRQQTTPVGSFAPNALGIYDMHGNVLERCLDTWHRHYKGAPTDGMAWIDNKHSSRVLRGGSWSSLSVGCRSAYRSGFNPNTCNSYIGFRVVCVVL